jgi:hypothetical protein
MNKRTESIHTWWSENGGPMLVQGGKEFIPPLAVASTLTYFFSPSESRAAFFSSTFVSVAFVFASAWRIWKTHRQEKNMTGINKQLEAVATQLESTAADVAGYATGERGQPELSFEPFPNGYAIKIVVKNTGKYPSYDLHITAVETDRPLVTPRGMQFIKASAAFPMLIPGQTEHGGQLDPRGDAGVQWYHITVSGRNGAYTISLGVSRARAHMGPLLLAWSVNVDGNRTHHIDPGFPDWDGENVTPIFGPDQKTRLYSGARGD